MKNLQQPFLRHHRSPDYQNKQNNGLAEKMLSAEHCSIKKFEGIDAFNEIFSHFGFGSIIGFSETTDAEKERFCGSCFGFRKLKSR